MKIRDVVAAKGREVHSVHASDTVAQTLSHFAGSEVRGLLVVDDGALIGVITLRDVVSFLDERGGAGLDAKVEEAMTREVVSVGPDADVEEVEGIFAQKRFQHRFLATPTASRALRPGR